MSYECVHSLKLAFFESSCIYRSKADYRSISCYVRTCSNCLQIQCFCSRSPFVQNAFYLSLWKSNILEISLDIRPSSLKTNQHPLYELNSASPSCKIVVFFVSREGKFFFCIHCCLRFASALGGVCGMSQERGV